MLEWGGSHLSTGYPQALWIKLWITLAQQSDRPSKVTNPARRGLAQSTHQRQLLPSFHHIGRRAKGNPCSGKGHPRQGVRLDFQVL